MSDHLPGLPGGMDPMAGKVIGVPISVEGSMILDLPALGFGVRPTIKDLVEAAARYRYIMHDGLVKFQQQVLGCEGKINRITPAQDYVVQTLSAVFGDFHMALEQRFEAWVRHMQAVCDHYGIDFDELNKELVEEERGRSQG